jgi:hypothetical protein
MYGVEGVRGVTAAIMAGVSFVATGNLAAPLAGCFAAQVGMLFAAVLNSGFDDGLGGRGGRGLPSWQQATWRHHWQGLLQHR